MSAIDLPELDGIATPPHDEDGPVFDEPWQAQAFALTLKLHQAGHFTWPEWVACLSKAIAAGRQDEAAGRASYYDHWLAALEAMVADKGLASLGELGVRKAEWRAAHERTPHGQPVVLPRHARDTADDGGAAPA